MAPRTSINYGFLVFSPQWLSYRNLTFLKRVKFVIFEGILSTSNVTSNVWSAIAAILVLHVALGMYIYRAYSETSKPKSDKDDKID
ncbi:VMA21-like domain [Popillia japonica]|uniref:VMA21-like domain n=1 Tax=Popillia japonica TaxID=7064 RepID=A0AAW1LWL7_POPJA